MTKSRGIRPAHYGWSRHETELLIDLWQKIPTKAIAVALGRTEGAVMAKTSRLDLPGLYRKRLKPEVFASVLADVSKETGVTASEVLSPARRREVCRARWLAFKRLRDMGYSYPQIAMHAKRNHTSVRHAVETLSANPAIYRAQQQALAGAM